MAITFARESADVVLPYLDEHEDAAEVVDLLIDTAARVEQLHWMWQAQAV